MHTLHINDTYGPSSWPPSLTSLRVDRCWDVAFDSLPVICNKLVIDHCRSGAPAHQDRRHLWRILDRITHLTYLQHIWSDSDDFNQLLYHTEHHPSKEDKQAWNRVSLQQMQHMVLSCPSQVMLPLMKNLTSSCHDRLQTLDLEMTWSDRSFNDLVISMMMTTTTTSTWPHLTHLSLRFGWNDDEQKMRPLRHETPPRRAITSRHQNLHQPLSRYYRWLRVIDNWPYQCHPKLTTLRLDGIASSTFSSEPSLTLIKDIRTIIEYKWLYDRQVNITEYETYGYDLPPEPEISLVTPAPTISVATDDVPVRRVACYHLTSLMIDSYDAISF